MKTMPSRVLITGAAGFIGSYIVDLLLGEGCDVIGIDNFVLGRRENLSEAFKNDRFELLDVDLADMAAAREALSKYSPESIDFVWHMAASSDISAGIADPDVDLQNTYMTTFNMLAFMHELAIPKLAFASSSAVYGDRGDILEEDSGPLFPISNYGAMKLASEASISAAVETFLERAWIFRFPNVIGRRSTHGVIYDFVNKLRSNSAELNVLGDGTQCKGYLHVSELLNAMIYVVDNAASRLNYFNIGNPDSGATVKFIAEEVVNAMASKAAIVYGHGNKGWVGDVPNVRYSIDKLQALGWKPTLSSEDAVRRAVVEQIAG